MPHDVDNSQNLIDSRDIIKRIRELEDERDSWQEDNNLPEYQDPETSAADWEGEEWTDEQVEKWQEWEDSEEGEELKVLKALADECEGYGDWSSGETLIKDSYFEEYAKEMCQDIGDLPKSLPSYIENNINWEGVAEDLQADYMEVDFDGEKYWMRS